MTIKYWVRESGKGSYCVGELPDGAYDKDTCIFVPKQPTPVHRWDNTAKEWKLSLKDKQNEIRGFRNPELSRTDKYMLSDYNAKFNEVDQAAIIGYRQLLRDAPDKETIAALTMPICPLCIKD